MKKTYLEPETTLLELVGNEALMQYLSLTVHNSSEDDDDDEVDDFDDLLSNHSNCLWEE